MDNSGKILKWIWLSLFCKISKGKIHKLLKEFGNIENIYNAQNEKYENLSFLKPEDVHNLCNKDLTKSENWFSALCKTDIFILTEDMPDFPQMLKNYPNYPLLLYCRGQRINLNRYISISVVGTRNPGQYGKNVTYSLSSHLASKGFIIISGMADGADSIAHEACLDSGTPTVAIVGCGPDIIYPRSNLALSKRICENGMIISEYPPKTAPERFRFPERNKLIAALSPATVVTEAAEKSGSLITANHAKSFGNIVFAVPGNITSTLSNGTNLLIATGAKAISSKDDIYTYFTECLGKEKLESFLFKAIPVEKTNKNPYPVNKTEEKEIKEKYASYSDDEKENIIIKCLCKKKMNIDELSYETNLLISDLNTCLLLMEIKGMIQKLPGDFYTAI